MKRLLQFRHWGTASNHFLPPSPLDEAVVGSYGLAGCPVPTGEAFSVGVRKSVGREGGAVQRC
jgi:hypothetical protein